MTMDFEKYTDRAKGFVQSAQMGAMRDGHPQLGPGASAEGAAGGYRGPVQRPDPARRRRRRARRCAPPRLSLGRAAEGLGRRGPAAGDRASWCACSSTAQKIAEKAGDSYVTVERLLLALAIEKDSEAGKILASRRRHAAEPERRHRRAPQGPHRRHCVGRERL